MQVGSATQCDAIVGLDRDQQRAKRARTLRLRQPMQVEGLGQRSGRLGLVARLRVGAARHRLQQLACILKITTPQQGCALAGEPVGGIGCHAVVRGDEHFARRWRTAFGTPAHRMTLAVLNPADELHRVHRHGNPALTNTAFTRRCPRHSALGATAQDAGIFRSAASRGNRSA